MESQIIGAQEINVKPPMDHKNGIRLPLIALGLDLIPVLFGSLLTSSFGLLLIVLSPIAGLIMGVISLIQGKERIGEAGKILAIFAVALPLIGIGFILIFFIGVVTGFISLM